MKHGTMNIKCRLAVAHAASCDSLCVTSGSLHEIFSHWKRSTLTVSIKMWTAYITKIIRILLHFIKNVIPQTTGTNTSHGHWRPAAIHCHGDDNTGKLISIIVYTVWNWTEDLQDTGLKHEQYTKTMSWHCCWSLAFHWGDQVQSQVSPCVTCGVQSGCGFGLCVIILVFCQSHSVFCHRHFIW